MLYTAQNRMERSFSTMNRVMTKLRNRMGQEMLQACVKISTEGDEEPTESFIDDFVKRYAVKKPQHISLMQIFTDPKDGVATAAARGYHHDTMGRPHGDGAFISSASSHHTDGAGPTHTATADTFLIWLLACTDQGSATSFFTHGDPHKTHCCSHRQCLLQQ
ncbi:uncharacterized protein LOC124555658 [Schistocerca americana]|uniref:uncharacterized protein LOC124555658 n=1 Tax=Schistocerca americana TaxID=7009 RepID=UPI001F4FB990|nr:uncharacterized protein LOC124555658 [Schistocerca americana]